MAVYLYNFRLTAEFIAGDPYSVIPSDTYPQSSRPGMLPFGWVDGSGGFTAANRNAGLAPQLGGVVLVPGSGGYQGFRVDLDAIGEWTIRLAIGDTVGGIPSTTVQLWGSGEGSAILELTTTTSGANRWRDATNNEWTETTWPTSNVPFVHTFIGTALTLYGWSNESGPGSIAHLGLESAAPSAQPVTGYHLQVVRPRWRR